MARMASTAILGGDIPTIVPWSISAEARQRMISDAAYYRYVQRGYAHGHDVEDWLAAEADFESGDLWREAPESGPVEELEIQQSGAYGPGEDDVLKRYIKQHPRREIPRIESVEPEQAPLKE